MISFKTSNDLFNKIRSKFGNIQIGNSMGEATANPGEAVFFDFDFREDGDSFGRVSISLADGESVKVFYNQGLVEKLEENDKTVWYSFLKELKDFAVTHQLGFDVRDITKNSLTKQDYKNIADMNQTVNKADMSEELNRIVKLSGLAEGLTGTARSSFENLDKTRLIIRHSKAVDENIPGDRTRNINSLYIENSQGERFKYPIVHLAGARAMARHVANGGVPHDDFGKHIVGVSEQIAQLNSFSRYTANKDQLNDSAGDIIERAKLKLETLRKYIKGLSKQKNYESIKETFQPSSVVEIDDATRNSLREKFTLKHMDDRVESALPLLHSIMQEINEAESELDQNVTDKDVEIPTPVNAAPLVQQYLADPENKLVLRKDASADTLLKRTKFTTKNAMLSSILSDIASRMLTKTPEQDRVANFASAVADEVGREGTPFFDLTKDYIANKKIAFQLAKRYVDDYKKMQQDPEYAMQVRQDPAEFGNPKKDRQGKAKESVEEQFEAWANRVVESTEPMIIDGKEVDPNTIEYDMQDYGDLIAPISDAKFIDGTELTPEQMEQLEGSDAYNEWVRIDYNERRMESAEQPVENVSIDDEYRFRDWLKKTHNKQVHELKPQEYAIISKQYRDERQGKEANKSADHFDTAMTQTAMDSVQDPVADPYSEGNEFALAVQKAKSAGMKPGDKFTVGDKEYTLKDAIELAGLKLEDFDFTSESVGGGATIRQMSDLELANFLNTTVAEVKKDREAAEEAAQEINQKYASDNESVEQNDLEEKKGKDLDHDGDIDSDDYLKARDIAIKQAQNKTVKEDELTIIKKLSGI